MDYSREKNIQHVLITWHLAEAGGSEAEAALLGRNIVVVKGFYKTQRKQMDLGNT